MRTPSLTLVAVLTLLAPQAAIAQGASDASIRQYLKLSGHEASAVENMNRIAPMLRQLAKDVPEDLWREITRTDNIVASVIPVYRKHFSEQEMQDLIAFHKTPTGSKYGTLASTIQREMLELGAKQAQLVIMNYQIQKGRFSVDPPK
jgi:hypothetical protein